MIPLPTLAEITQIEKNLNREFPKSFKKYVSRHRNFKSLQFSSEDISFIKGIDDIKKFSKQSACHISSLLLFFIDRANQDYYCFDKNNKVVVFSIHTIVHEWKDFGDWINWCNEKNGNSSKTSLNSA